MITSGFAATNMEQKSLDSANYITNKIGRKQWAENCCRWYAPASISHDGSMTFDRGESIGKCTATYHVYHTWQVSYQTPIC